ncbi:lasso peptide biosynthesis B2 protein [Stenotrophomonas mori]|uniref:Lasso peptide biosynthesis B2 protein n=1 Tax=Stenotrophomonas mori TaxID=2871096 RepID=A0ABT0SI34_9GAMM|nr:lasso peptide biosynthesis B2 protein [Stenotrophomonas mori]MCL7714975.1 lasso peptide biosynthesis B2 protein [Stenotrophomonas mori]
MRLGLRHGLSYCVSDGIVIFLDVDLDRYFRLPPPLEQAFLAYADTGTAHVVTLQPLIDGGILSDASDALPLQEAPRIAAPSDSAIECITQQKRSAITLLPEVSITTWWMRRQLMNRPLKAVLETAAEHRRRCVRSVRSPRHRAEEWLLETVQAFQRARRQVPVPTRCLLDSLTLTRVLACRGQDSRIVFGIAHAPFSAHCWVQVDGLVLNESVGTAMAHTPIKVV